MMRVLMLLAAIVMAPSAFAQDTLSTPGVTAVPNADVPTFVINLRDADLRALAEQVSEITGRTLILDAAVIGKVTVISAAPLDKDGVWDLFQSVLAVQGFATVPSGKLWRVVTQQAAKESGGGGSAVEATTRLDIITRLVPLENFPVSTAVLALRPLVAASGYLEAVPETNTLVITDTAENVGRIENIALSLDAGSGKQIYTLPIRNGDATEIAASVQNILAQEAGTAGSRVTVDARSNVLIFNGDEKTYDLVRTLVVDLDIPGRPVASSVPVTRVYALKFADATSMSEMLRGLVSGGTMATNPVAEALQSETIVLDENGQAVPISQPPPVTNFATEDITIQPVLESNSVVVRAREEVQVDLSALIAQLDQRRPQVLIEAAIVEVSGDISEQVGVQLGLGAAAPPGGFAATSFSTTGPSVQNLLALLGKPVAPAVSAGLSIGLTRGDQFGLLLQAFGQSTKANLLSTPSITTLDNQPAEIIVGQNVPFRTGSFSTNGGVGTPFTTIERRDVGITMRVTPRVNQGDVVQLEISQEVSSLLNTNVAGAADLVTNRRSIKTTVLADNGGTIVLGGLITDDRQASRGMVPGLGNMPVLGPLFRSRNDSARRQTLFIFLRPTILRSRSDVAQAAEGSFLRLKSIETETARESGSILNEARPMVKLPLEIDGLY